MDWECGVRGEVNLGWMVSQFLSKEFIDMEFYEKYPFLKQYLWSTENIRIQWLAELSLTVNFRIPLRNTNGSVSSRSVLKLCSHTCPVPGEVPYNLIIANITMQVDRRSHASGHAPKGLSKHSSAKDLTLTLLRRAGKHDCADQNQVQNEKDQTPAETVPWQVS